LILMSGPSGAGKSSIMQSIYWCLYGGMRNIYSNSMKTGRMSVTLQMNNCTIYRQGRPNLFRIVLSAQSNNTYEDEVAQTLIDRMFGPKDLWKSCCYIDQNSRCTLLTGSNNERMELLNRLSFSTDDPEACISRIDAELKSLREQFTIIQAVYSSECETFGRDLALTPVDPNAMVMISQLSNMKSRIPSMSLELSLLDQTRMEQMRLVGMKNALSENLSRQMLEMLKMKDDPDCKNMNINSTSLHSMTVILTREEQDLSQYRTEHMEYIQNKSTYEHATREININKEQLGSIPQDQTSQINSIKENIIDSDGSISRIEQTIGDLKQYHKQMEELKTLEGKISQYDSDLNIHLTANYTEGDVWENKQQEQSYVQNLTLAQKFGIEYTTEAISKCRQEHCEKMEFESMLESRLAFFSQIRALETELSTIPIQDHDLIITDDQVLAARDEYTRLSQSSDLLSCPHCGKSVRYVDHTLQPDTMIPVTLDQVKDALDKVTILFTRQNNQKKAIGIKSQIEALLPGAQITGNDRSELEQLISVGGEQRMSLQQRQSIISQLDQIKVVEKPSISSDIMTTLISYQKLKESIKDGSVDGNMTSQQMSLTAFQQQLIEQKQKKQQMLDQINSIMINSSNRRNLEQSLIELTSKLSGLKIGVDRIDDIKQSEEKINFYKRQMTKWEQILKMEEEIVKIKQQISAIVIIEDIEDKYTIMSKEIDTLKQQIESTEHAERMCNKQRELEVKRDQVVQMTSDLTHLQKLRQTAVDVECQQLQTTVDSINNAMSDILDNIFEDPITVRIQLYKQLKSNKSLKPSVNLSISYKGAEYDSINQMSGGEGDRISFALILALNQVSTSPLLMLDESMSSINANLRESCLRSLRESVGITKTVLVINHEDVEGHYDDVIRF
jgi:DNA repair exonuclease SbcCD ATPase subunit